ncbi:hypothetical protein, partial [Xanthovirga aplysinae]|uniref:hypothetical protein n=1 Tax=Xanthovirga aplysinae TaxID=2529853 RepID=UPI001CA40942
MVKVNITYGGKRTQYKVDSEPPKPKVIVDFRPSNNYDGEYGFDYMRNKKDKGDYITYKDIMGTNNGTQFTKYPTDTQYNKLKDDHYNTLSLPWHKDQNGKEVEYLQSWLALYPGQSATLSVQIDTLENPQELKLEYDKKLFKLNTDSIPAQKKGKNRLGDHLTISCLKEFSSDQEIKVMYKDRQVGQLNVLKNDKNNRYKAKVVFVRVKTELLQRTKLTGNTINSSGAPEKEMLERYLKQSLIKLELVEKGFNLTLKDPITKKPLYP